MKKALCLLLLNTVFFSVAQTEQKLTVAQRYVLDELVEKVPAVVETDFRGAKLSYYCDSTVHYAHRDSSSIIRTECLKVDVGEKIIVEEFDSNNEFTWGKLGKIGEFESGRMLRAVTMYDTLQAESQYSYSPEGALQQIRIMSKGETKAVISWTYPDSLTANSTLDVPDQPQNAVTNRLHFYPSGKIKSNESYDDKGGLVNLITYAYDDRNRLIEERAPRLVKMYVYASNDSILRTVKIIGKDTTSCVCTFSGNTKSCIFGDKRIDRQLQETTFNDQGKPVTYKEMDMEIGIISKQTDYTYTRSGKPLSAVTMYIEDGSVTTFHWQYSRNENKWVERHYMNDYPISVRYVVHKY